MPETNLLDLGFWTALQSAIESLSCRKRQCPDAHVSVVLNTWANLTSKTIGKLCKRWTKVLDLALKDNGENWCVEQERGILANDPTRDN